MTYRQVKSQFVVATAITINLSFGCSAVTSVYQLADYSVSRADAVKRIAVACWAPPASTGLSALLGRIAADIVMLRKNYLVYDVTPVSRSFAEACTDREGVLALRVLGIEQSAASKVTMVLNASLYRCGDGALLWQAHANGSAHSDDSDLTELTASYVRTFGDAGSRYAAVSFVLLQDLVRELPNPTLNDDEIMEKIELGRSLNAFPGSNASATIATIPVRATNTAVPR